MSTEKLKRNTRITLNRVEENSFSITDKEGNTLVESTEDYYIYFKNANLRDNGAIDGRYLGENPELIVDGKSKEIHYSSDQGLWFNDSGKKPYKTARLVAVNNKTKVIIIIEND